MSEEKDPQDTYSFMQETIKDNKINKKKLKKISIVIALLGIVFGITASAGFVMAKPWLESIFDVQQTVEIPSDEVLEVNPEQSANDVKEAVKEEVKEELKEELLKEELVEKAENAEDVMEFEKIYKELYMVAREASRSVVTVWDGNIDYNNQDVLIEIQKMKDVTAPANEESSEIEGAEVETESEAEAESEVAETEDEQIRIIGSTGIVVAVTNSEVLVLAPIDRIQNTDKIKVKLSDGTEVNAKIKKEYKILGYAILSVDKLEVPKGGVELAKLGNSFITQQGEMAIALGNQFAYEDGLGYGVISSTKNKLRVVDGTYGLISTDIPVAQEGSGILVNTKGEVIGLINTKQTGAIAVEAIGISELKPIIECLSNGGEVPYLGILSKEINEDIAMEQSIPMGLYVQEVEAGSPAMRAGVQCGDIITSVNNNAVINMGIYGNELLKCQQSDNINLCIQRLGLEEYVEMKFNIIVGEEK